MVLIAKVIQQGSYEEFKTFRPNLFQKAATLLAASRS